MELMEGRSTQYKKMKLTPTLEVITEKTSDNRGSQRNDEANERREEEEEKKYKKRSRGKV